MHAYVKMRELITSSVLADLTLSSLSVFSRDLFVIAREGGPGG